MGKVPRLKSDLAHQTVEMLNLWSDFRKVIDFLDTNRSWLDLFNGAYAPLP